MDCYLLADMHNDKVILFVSQLDNMYKIWMNIMKKDEYAQKYQLEVKYMSELEDCLKQYDGKLYINAGTNTDSNLKTCIPDEKYT